MAPYRLRQAGLLARGQATEDVRARMGKQLMAMRIYTTQRRSQNT